MPVASPQPHPLTNRRGARVLVVAGSRVLLMRDTDLGVPGSLWWTPPGGGIDPGESETAAAKRELFEETGLLVDEVGGPIATRTVTHVFSDHTLVQEETFFRVDTDAFEPRPVALTAAERDRELAGRWFDLTELAHLNTWPADMAALLSASESEPIHWGEVEESP